MFIVVLRIVNRAKSSVPLDTRARARGFTSVARAIGAEVAPNYRGIEVDLRNPVESEATGGGNDHST